ncbi:hypothetical protein [Tepidibacillus sp. HK-1]|uniref:hypothetical protein n=1 Tax=Tepidibacillus sp. HK-1 TaxID=1883407 RepID=UPI000853E548|nr:hypothetical protein [Tepidibacillus sp. HK-1]GBF10476.1 hypothetical protein HK1_00488 [Tepidibacillus sp. HK-1]
MYWIILIIVAAISLLIVNYLFFMGKKFNYGGVWSSSLAALIGAWLGDILLGDWGWMALGYNILAGFIGSLVITYLWDLIAVKRNK